MQSLTLLLIVSLFAYRALAKMPDDVAKLFALMLTPTNIFVSSINASSSHELNHFPAISAFKAIYYDAVRNF
jgi:hypothetical protein